MVKKLYSSYLDNVAWWIVCLPGVQKVMIMGLIPIHGLGFFLVSQFWHVEHYYFYTFHIWPDLLECLHNCHPTRIALLYKLVADVTIVLLQIGVHWVIHVSNIKAQLYLPFVSQFFWQSSPSFGDLHQLFFDAVQTQNDLLHEIIQHVL